MINNILDGKEKLSGISSEPWENTRQRLFKLCEPSPGLEEVAKEVLYIHPNADKEWVEHQLRRVLPILSRLKHEVPEERKKNDE